jgi:hypothetical protein
MGIQRRSLFLGLFEKSRGEYGYDFCGRIGKMD